MQRYLHSFRCAVAGLRAAWASEHNLKLFVTGYVLSIILGLLLQIDLGAWLFVLLSGGTFLSIELLNTAIEHFSDAFDAHAKTQNDIHFEAIRATKDIAAGAALVSALTWIVILGVVFVPYGLFRLGVL